MKARPGREVALQTLNVACLARALVDRYGVRPKKCAVLAALESVAHHFPRDDAHVTLAAAQRAFEGLDRQAAKYTPTGEKFTEALITQGVIDDAMRRLPVTARFTGWKDCEPAPPFAIAVAHLFDPES